jgi:fucose 4-O-acetylase-like acetyltransferase
MNATQLPFLVEALIILAAAAFGWFIRRAKKPYRAWKVTVHLFFFAWFSMGYWYITEGLSFQSYTLVLGILTGIVGLAIAVQIVTGLVLLFSKTSRQRLPAVHLGSAVVMLVSDLAALVAAGFAA